MDYDHVPEDLLQQILSANVDPTFEDIEPYVQILLQPKQRGYRFRYSSEGNTHGGIPAETSEKGQKKYPTIQIANYSGKAAVCVSLVTAEDPPHVHPHNLVGKDVKNGFLYCEEKKENWVLSFPNLGIEHVTKKDLVKVLHEKLCQQYQVNLVSQYKPDDGQSFDISALVDSFGGSDTNVIDQSLAKVVEEEEKKRLLEEAKKLAKETNLSAIRLCFQAFLADETGFLTKPLKPVYSNPIYDQKAAHAGQLRICRISRSSGSVHGDEEIFLLCDKVQKEDISVRFFLEDQSTNELKWEEFGKFNQTDVHKQCAIVFKTPQFIDKAIQKPIEVQIQLKRGKDGECSNAIPFTYTPAEYDQYKIGEKRRKGLPEDLDEILQTAAAAKQPRLPATSTATQQRYLQMNVQGSSTADSSAKNVGGIRFFNQPR